jgi:antitoxin ParD1/3/4
MNVSLTPELEKFVANKVDSGRYTSASEVVREALRLLEEKELTRVQQLDAFEKEITFRMESLERNRYVGPDTVRDRIRAKAAAHRKHIA